MATANTWKTIFYVVLSFSIFITVAGGIFAGLITLIFFGIPPYRVYKKKERLKSEEQSED